LQISHHPELQGGVLPNTAPVESSELSLPHQKKNRKPSVDDIKRLIESGMDVNQVFPDGETAFIKAIKLNSHELVNYLIEVHLLKKLT
jgi:ankyrin repeat protein